ncbi:hypothetical protein CASFOL_029785 [Castilleja foliolosa]|uniref:Phytocyanin domain-containing protein n=1 Tax=Castilleja foliolosa TaxID=1961234 RepID=A0ABD3CA83_9LAMI
MSVRGAIVAAATVAIMVVLHFDEAEAAAINYVVGNEKGVTSVYGWTANSPSVDYYPSSFDLNRGDTLQFIYNKDVHNVVGVGQNRYDTCNGSKGTEYTGGNNTIMLKPGMNYFICTKPGNSTGNMCKAYTMKIKVNAN